MPSKILNSLHAEFNFINQNLIQNKNKLKTAMKKYESGIFNFLILIQTLRNIFANT
jgi:hypothetical protein